MAGPNVSKQNTAQSNRLPLLARFFPFILVLRVLQVTFDRYSPLQTRITQKELQVCTLFTLPILQLMFLNMYILDNLSEKIRN